jgi:predicted metalloprotease with PDZ domain
MRIAFAASLLAIAVAGPALAQQGNSMPQPIPFEDTIPAARDVDYPGVMTLKVDATDLNRAIFRVEQTIPVPQAGRMTLLFPAWLPGNHAPRGQIDKLAGLVIKAGGRVLPWVRDEVDVYAFHIDVPEGAKTVTANFDFLSATAANQGRIVVAPSMMNIQWEAVSLYPAGYYTRRIPVKATVTYPQGWTARSGLPATNTGNVYSYQQTSYETLIDSPVFAGRYFKEWALSPRVDLNVFADEAKYLEAKPEQIAAHSRLVDQAVKLFGAQHYDHYEFLLALTDEMGGIGLEHHRSSENGVNPEYFTEWDTGPGRRNLLPHEFTHSWDGKFRRGANLWTPDFKTPMRDNLLWVYEGQTQFWGYVLQARSGLVSKQDTLDQLAQIYAVYDNWQGREWRPMVDTTHDPIISSRRPKGWSSYQRSEDYYNEGLLIWLEADSVIRKQSNGAKSMDDFARAFFGMRDGDWGVLTYNFDDVVSTLNGVVPYDWRTFLDDRVNKVNPRAPLKGFTDNGYQVVYTEEPTGVWKEGEKGLGGVNLNYSGGLSVKADGTISTVMWGSPAFDADLDINDKIIAVGERAFTGDALKDAIKAAKGKNDPVKLTVTSEDRVRTVDLKWNQGLRYPRLQKTGTGETGLDRLLTAK